MFYLTQIWPEQIAQRTDGDALFSARTHRSSASGNSTHSLLLGSSGSQTAREWDASFASTRDRPSAFASRAELKRELHAMQASCADVLRSSGARSSRSAGKQFGQQKFRTRYSNNSVATHVVGHEKPPAVTLLQDDFREAEREMSQYKSKQLYAKKAAPNGSLSARGERPGDGSSSARGHSNAASKVTQDNNSRPHSARGRPGPESKKVSPKSAKQTDGVFRQRDGNGIFAANTGMSSEEEGGVSVAEVAATSQDGDHANKSEERNATPPKPAHALEQSLTENQTSKNDLANVATSPIVRSIPLIMRSYAFYSETKESTISSGDDNIIPVRVEKKGSEHDGHSPQKIARSPREVEMKSSPRARVNARRFINTNQEAYSPNTRARKANHDANVKVEGDLAAIFGARFNNE